MTQRERQLIQQARTRHGRRKAGVFLVEGLRCCREALTRCGDALEFAVLSRGFADSADAALLLALVTRHGRPLETVADADFAKLAATESPQGILCVFRAFPEPSPATAIADPFVLILDRVAEPGNLGTILRTAWAVGLREVWYTEGSSDPFGPKAIRAGMGAQFALTLRRFAALADGRAELARLGISRLWCAVPTGGVDCFAAEFAPAGSGLVIGNEANGVQDLAGTTPVTIPMPGTAESLNAAQAATILLFETVRRGLLGRRS